MPSAEYSFPPPGLQIIDNISGVIRFIRTKSNVSSIGGPCGKPPAIDPRALASGQAQNIDVVSCILIDETFPVWRPRKQHLSALQFCINDRRQRPTFQREKVEAEIKGGC